MDFTEEFCESSREHARDVTNFKIKKMKLLTNKQQKSYQNVKILYVCQERFEYEYCQVRSHCHEVLHKTSVI